MIHDWAPRSSSPTGIGCTSAILERPTAGTRRSGGEGRTLAVAASHLVNQLNCGLDFVHGSEREAVERAVAEVRAFQSSRPRHRPGALAAVP